METRLHRSSGSHQRVAKHFRAQLTEAQAKRCALYLHLPPHFLVAISVIQENYIFIHPYAFPFQNSALLSSQMRRKICISIMPTLLPERSLFLIFFIVSASLPSQLSPAAVGSKPGPKGMAVVQRWGTTLWGGMRRGRESEGQIAVSSSFGKLVHQKLPTLGVWITQTPLASATFR